MPTASLSFLLSLWHLFVARQPAFQWPWLVVHQENDYHIWLDAIRVLVRPSPTPLLLPTSHHCNIKWCHRKIMWASQSITLRQMLGTGPPQCTCYDWSSSLITGTCLETFSCNFSKCSKLPQSTATFLRNICSIQATLTGVWNTWNKVQYLSVYKNETANCVENHILKIKAILTPKLLPNTPYLPALDSSQEQLLEIRDRIRLETRNMWHTSWEV